MMNSTIAKNTASSIVLTLAALGCASSFAANMQNGTEGEALYTQDLMSTKTRAEVQAGYLQAVKAGQLVAMTEGTMLVGPAFMSTRTREEVRAEAVMAGSHPLNTGSI